MSENVKSVIDYILEHESEDFGEWCGEESRDIRKELETGTDHIYSSAWRAAKENSLEVYDWKTEIDAQKFPICEDSSSIKDELESGTDHI